MITVLVYLFRKNRAFTRTFKG